MNSDVSKIVIGAGGFIGKQLSKSLYSVGGSLALFGSNIQQAEFPSAYVSNTRLQDFNCLDGFVGNETVIYYLVNTLSPSNNEHSTVLDDLSLFVRFLSWVSKHQNVKVVYTSSGGTVYSHNIQHDKLMENDALDPISFYGMGKVSAENYLKLFARKYGFQYTVARISNPYGIGQNFLRNQGLIAMVLNRVRRGEEVTIFGDGSMVRDYIYITDLVEGLLKMAVSEGVDGEVINIGSGVGTSVSQVVDAVEELMGGSISRSYREETGFHVQSNILNISKAERLLGWAPKVSFKEGLTLFVGHITKDD